MSDPQPPSPDWDAVFHHARRRIFTRVLVVGSIAALGALLLLGGGLSAQGTVTLRIPGKESDAKSETTSKKQKNPHKGKPQQKSHDKHHHSGHSNGNGVHHKKKQTPPPHKKHHSQWNPCGGNAAGEQYCDAPEEGPTPEPTKGVDGESSV